MYCKNCGSTIDDKAVICPNCGVSTDDNRVIAQRETNVLAIVGFIFSFFIPLVGLICSSVGYNNANKLGGSGKGLAIAGIVISTISIAFALFLTLIWGIIFLIAAAAA